MKKNIRAIIIFFISGFFVNSFLYAQKIPLKTVKFKHVQLPLEPLGDNVKTYHSEVSIALPESLVKEAGMNSLRISLDGFQSIRTEERTDIRINLKFGEFGLIDKKRIKDDVYHINTGSNETGYYNILTFDYPAELIVSTWDYKVLLHREIHPDSSVRIVDFGKWTFSEDELNNKFDSEISELQAGIQKKCVNSVMRMARNLVNSHFGYPLVTEHLKIAIVKSKKGPFYSELAQAAGFAEEALTKNKKYEVNPESTALMNKAIDIWEKVLAGYKHGSQNKGSSDLVMMMFYNSAQGYLWINRFEDARSRAGMATRMMVKDTQKKYVKVINELWDKILDREQRYKANY